MSPKSNEAYGRQKKSQNKMYLAGLGGGDGSDDGSGDGGDNWNDGDGNSANTGIGSNERIIITAELQ